MFCWSHLRNDPGYARYNAQNNRKIDRLWALKVRSDASASKYFEKPSPDAIIETFADNLEAYAADTLAKKAVRHGLRQFKEAYLAADGARLQGMTAGDFRQIEKLHSKVLSVRDRTAAFDFQKHARKVNSIDINLKSVVLEAQKGVVNAIATVSYHGKYFTTRFLEVFSFSYDRKKARLLIRQTRSHLEVTNPRLHDVRIFVVRHVSKNDVKEAFSSTSVDEKIDEILEGRYEKFPSRQGVYLLYLFREAPRVGSIIRTHFGQDLFEYKVESNDPYFLVANDARMGISNFRV
jgi:hypothetical protein